MTRVAPQAALIVPVREAEPVVDELRQRYDATAAIGVPAHITLLYPFVSPKKATAFEFWLSGVGRFTDTVYLQPSPSAPFISLIKAFVDAFPDYPPYGGLHTGSIPHLTVARESEPEALERIEDEVRLLMAKQRAIQCYCKNFALIVNTEGRWVTQQRFSLVASEANGQWRLVPFSSVMMMLVEQDKEVCASRTEKALVN